MRKYLTLTGDPRTKKNSQQILVNKKTGKAFVAPSKAYKDYEQSCLWQLSKHKWHLNQPLNVRCIYFMKTRRIVDLPNLQEATLDILVRAGVIEDDNSRIVVSMDGSFVTHDKERPRVEIIIESLDDIDVEPVEEHEYE